MPLTTCHLNPILLLLIENEYKRKSFEKVEILRKAIWDLQDQVLYNQMFSPWSPHDASWTCTRCPVLQLVWHAKEPSLHNGLSRLFAVFIWHSQNTRHYNAVGEYKHFSRTSSKTLDLNSFFKLIFNPFNFT